MRYITSQSFASRSRRTSGKRMLLLFLVIFFVIFAIILHSVDTRVRPMLASYGGNQAVTAATLAVNNAAEHVIEEMAFDYGDLTTITRGSDNSIVSIQIHSTNMNLLKSAVSRAVLEELETQEVQQIAIPAGSLFGGLLTGRGPDIKIKVPMNTTVDTDYNSSFDGAGINQTRHLLSIDVNVKIFAVIYGEDTAVEVNASFTLAENILVGEVPNWMRAVDG